MKTLKLRINKYLEGKLGSLQGIVANIYEYPEERKRTLTPVEISKKRNLIMPLGSQKNDFLEIKIEPGRYIIELILPSGSTVSQDIQITATPDTQELIINTNPSPHEWLGWQQLMGHVEEDSELYKLRMDARRLPDILDKEVRLSVFNKADFLKDKEVWNLFLINKISLNPVAQDSLSRIFHLTSRIFENSDYAAGISQFNYSEEGNPFYAMVEDFHGKASLCALPIPWISAYDNAEAVVELLVQAPPPFPMNLALMAPPRISVVVRDTVSSAIIGYLASGDLPSAATVLEPATDMLYGKSLNPFAAAAGGYVLLETEAWNSKSNWHQWIANLMNWFPGLPDGAIQYAWLKLRHRNGEKDLTDARNCLLEAVKRGIPLYSMGVGLLRDGLVAFANDARSKGNPDMDVEIALRVVQSIALHTNMRQPFTIISF